MVTTCYIHIQSEIPSNPEHPQLIKYKRMNNFVAPLAIKISVSVNSNAHCTMRQEHQLPNSIRDENTGDRIVNIASLNIILRMHIIVNHQHNITCQRKIVCLTSFSPLILLVAKGLTMFLHNLYSENSIQTHIFN